MRNRRKKFIAYHYKKFRREYEGRESDEAKKRGSEEAGKAMKRGSEEVGKRGGSRATIAYLPLWKRGIKGDLVKFIIKSPLAPLFKEGDKLIL
jgi:hypothetical protein